MSTVHVSEKSNQVQLILKVIWKPIFVLCCYRNKRNTYKKGSFGLKSFHMDFIQLQVNGDSPACFCVTYLNLIKTIYFYNVIN